MKKIQAILVIVLCFTLVGYFFSRNNQSAAPLIQPKTTPSAPDILLFTDTLQKISFEYSSIFRITGNETTQIRVQSDNPKQLIFNVNFYPKTSSSTQIRALKTIYPDAEVTFTTVANLGAKEVTVKNYNYEGTVIPEVKTIFIERGQDTYEISFDNINSAHIKILTSFKFI